MKKTYIAPPCVKRLKVKVGEEKSLAKLTPTCKRNHVLYFIYNAICLHVADLLCIYFLDKIVLKYLRISMDNLALSPDRYYRGV